MRKLMKYGVVLALVMAVPSAAQVFTPTAATNAPVSQYVVQSGDNLWELAELRLSDPEEWRWLVSQNSFLQEPGRQFTRADGTFVVLIRPGETIRGLEEVGITPASTAMATPQGTGETVVVVGKSFGEKLADWLGSNWGWLLLLLGIGIVAWFLRELGKDPVRSGAPQVAGGVNDETVRVHFEGRGTARGFTLIPGSTVRGRGYGRMMVSYRGSAERPRTLNGETIYRARARFYDGREEDIFMLQGCGNDVTTGGNVYRLLNNFRFVEDEAVAEPSPEPVVEEVTAPVQEDTVLNLTDVAPVSEASDRPELKIELKPAEKPGDTAMVRVTGAPTEDLVFTVTDDGFTLRFHPPVK